MGNPEDSDSLHTIQHTNGFQNFLPAGGIQHGCCLIRNDDGGFHSQDTGYGYTLLLTA